MTSLIYEAVGDPLNNVFENEYATTIIFHFLFFNDVNPLSGIMYDDGGEPR